jgi:HSP20 family protein
MHAPFDPLSELDRLQHELGDVTRATRSAARDRARPAVDVYERGGEVIVVVELPGVKPQDVRVHVDGDRVTVSGRRARAEIEASCGCFRMETSCGAFRRTVTLPAKVDATRGEAKMEDGILTLRLPTLTPHGH